MGLDKKLIATIYIHYKYSKKLIAAIFYKLLVDFIKN